MQWTYDPSVDALAIELAPHAKSVRTVTVAPGCFADLDATGRVITIEMLDASTRYDARALRKLEAPTLLLSLEQASKTAGLAAATLRQHIHRQRLKATKRGRDWWVSRAALDAYLASRKPQGRRSVKKRAFKRAG